MKQTYPLTRDLVLIGGGHSHALMLRQWGMQPLPGVRLTVIDPAPTAAYSGMLPGYVAGHYGRDDLDIDLVKLARFAGARLVMGAVDGIDLAARRISVPGRPSIAYDVAAIDIGITSSMPALPGFAEHGVPAKPLTPFARKWAAFLEADGPAQVVVIGGGVAGAELAMAMAHALAQSTREAEVRLIDRSRALKEATPSGRRKVLAAMRDLGVEVIEEAQVERVEADHVALSDGRTLPSRFTVGAAGAQPHDWLAKTGLDLHDGFITVGETLQSSDPSVFATGDCAHLSHDPRPKAGVYAVRQAPVLHDNLVATLSGGTMQSYWPQKDYLKLISLGGKRALAEKWGRAFSGPLLWRWKDHIDLAFMTKFKELPKMEAVSVPRTAADGLAEILGAKPMCGGCGAKVGRGALRGALAALPKSDRADVEAVPGDDAAMLRVGGQRQVISTDHLRAFTDDPVVMTRIAAIHALGDVWAMGATPQAATATVILPRMSADLQERSLAEIMAAAAEVMSDAGAAIVGGHSSMSDEMTIGFTVTGLCDADPITIAGAKEGDVLILTKPIGSGVIMAAEMAGEARGDIVAEAFASMVQPQGAASRILANAHAMTDVTGFGLAGHVAGICEASGLSAAVDIAAVPLMEGALELSEAGIGSTLLPDNKAGAGVVIGAIGPRGDLMFDPQTAGGLLACVPQTEAAAILTALQEAGYPAARIGQMVAGVGVRFR
ncbi:selenide, water dikinase SelD [Flavimaricola marinus]|uniref:Selenide, water dikinase n=1 Tax=Flavimaricola marinus TaxID=1819565 RepID=A0A238LC70_9RHOB|nr:selenide, water dikinase SelD [Flavimaricola marinus]SMY07004.1 Selenide, water dikinase [Flavimaricola marinus]